MKNLMVLVVVLLFSVMAWATACPTTYGNTYSITIAAQTTLYSNQTNFPMYFAGNSALATYSLSSGVDVVFCSTGGAILPYELVAGTWNGSTGAGEWWIQVPTVSYTTAQTIYLVVGKASATNYSAPASVWSSYLGVWHGGTSSTLTLTDSTGNSTATNHGATAVAGEINGGSNYLGSSSQWLDTGATQTGLTSFTLEAWVGPTATAQAFPISNRNSSATGGIFLMDLNSLVNACPGYSSGSSFYYRCSSAALGGVGVFAQVAATHTAGNSNQIALYINGGLDTAGTTGSSGFVTDPGNSSTTLQFGRDGADSTPYYYTGKLDEVRLSNVVRSADWIKAGYLNQFGPTSFYSFASVCLPPTYSPVAGIYSGAQTVTITDGCSTICYSTTTTPAATTPGTCSTGTTYSSPVVISASVSLQAIGTQSGYITSSVTNGSYVIGSSVAPTSVSVIQPF
jgi:hypothetical protein